MFHFRITIEADINEFHQAVFILGKLNENIKYRDSCFNKSLSCEIYPSQNSVQVSQPCVAPSGELETTDETAEL